jgi:hypothetical protein
VIWRDGRAVRIEPDDDVSHERPGRERHA